MMWRQTGQNPCWEGCSSSPYGTNSVLWCFCVCVCVWEHVRMGWERNWLRCVQAVSAGEWLPNAHTLKKKNKRTMNATGKVRTKSQDYRSVFFDSVPGSILKHQPWTTVLWPRSIYPLNKPQRPECVTWFTWNCLCGGSFFCISFRFSVFAVGGIFCLLATHWKVLWNIWIEW